MRQSFSVHQPVKKVIRKHSVPNYHVVSVPCKLWSLWRGARKGSRCKTSRSFIRYLLASAGICKELAVVEDDLPCVMADLLKIQREERSERKRLVSLSDCDSQLCEDLNEMDEVYPGIFLGGELAAYNVEMLQHHGITHILNAAQGDDDYHIPSNKRFYSKLSIKVLALPLSDQVTFPIEEYFKKTSRFIDKCQESNGNILVHCVEGVSRSPTVIMAYLMMNKQMTARQAMRRVCRARRIDPNDGFIDKLCELNETLRRRGHFNVEVTSAGDAQCHPVVEE